MGGGKFRRFDFNINTGVIQEAGVIPNSTDEREKNLSLNQSNLKDPYEAKLEVKHTGKT